MASTKIEWATDTWNPVTGCTPISEGCQNCYARRVSSRLRGRFGYDKDEPFKVTLHLDKLEQPLKWRKPRRVFVCSMGDLFHEDVNEEYIAKVLAVCALSRQHTYIILTKRPQRMWELFTDRGFQSLVGWFESQAVRKFGVPAPDQLGPWPLSNLWLGVTVESQARADERIPILLQIPAAVRFVSIEPMLGPVDLTFDVGTGMGHRDSLLNYGIDWVICGGETGPGARPVHPDWVRNLRDQCQASGTPFFFKSWGDYCAPSQMPDDTYRAWEYEHGTEACWENDNPRSWKFGKKKAGRLLDGREWDEYPEVKA